MVELKEQIIALCRFINPYSEQPFSKKLIGPYQLLLTQGLTDFHLKRQVVISFLPDITVFIHIQRRLNIWMCLHSRLKSCFQPPKIYIFPKPEQKRNVINGAARIGRTLNKNTILCLGQRINLPLFKFFLLPNSRKEPLQLLNRVILLQILITNHSAVKCVREQNIQLYSPYRGQSCLINICGHAKFPVADNFRHTVKNPLLYLAFRRYKLLCRTLRHRKGALIHFLVLVQRNLIYLHCHSRNHVGRLALLDKCMQRLHIHSPLRHHVSGDILPARRLVKCRYSCIRNSRESADDLFYLRKLDAEAPHLHLSVAPADELNIPIRQETHNIPRMVNPSIPFKITEWICRIHLCRLLRTVQIPAAHLIARNTKLTWNTDRNPSSHPVQYIELHIGNGLSNRELVLILSKGVSGYIDRTLRRSINIIVVRTALRLKGRQSLPAHNQIPKRIILHTGGKRPPNLGSHESMGNSLPFYILI